MRFLQFIFAILSAVLLTGCVEIIDDLTLNSDGSGCFKYNVNLSSSKIKINAILALDSLDGKRVPTLDEIKKLLGRARAKKGIFEGDLVNGELEIGQIAGLINEVKSVNRVFEEILKEFNDSKVLINRF